MKYGETNNTSLSFSRARSIHVHDRRPVLTAKRPRENAISGHIFICKDGNSIKGQHDPLPFISTRREWYYSLMQSCLRPLDLCALDDAGLTSFVVAESWLALLICSC